jgi:hypothetical protein
MGAIALVLAAAPAFGWGDDGHFLITREAVERLPQPLRGYFLDDGALERLQNASIAPDQWREAERKKEKADPLYVPTEKPKHYFDVDVLKDRIPAPFTAFPRDRAEVECLVGPERMDQLGTGLWAVQDTLQALVEAMTLGRADDLIREAGALAHYVADLHMPFHTTTNYDGQESGNPGIHRALEIGLVKRYPDFYAAEIRRDRTIIPYLGDPREATFGWIVTANSRVAPILEADTIARRQTGYDPKLWERPADGSPSDLDDVESARARPYYARLKKELQDRGSPEAAAMRDAAQHVAQCLYTAYVLSGQQVGREAVPAEEQTAPPFPYWAAAAGVLVMVVLLWLRRRPRAAGGSPP